MSNPAFPDLIKIGKSTKDPTTDRVSELNQTGVPQPFKVEYYSLVENENLLERLIHQHFENARPNKNREFFNIDPAIAINIIRELALEHSPIKYEEVFYLTPEQLKVARKKRDAIEAAEKKKIEDEREARIKQREDAKVLKLEAAEKEKATLTKDKKERLIIGIILYLILLSFYSYLIFVENGDELTIGSFSFVIMTSIIAWFIFVYWWLRKWKNKHY